MKFIFLFFGLSVNLRMCKVQEPSTDIMGVRVFYAIPIVKQDGTMIDDSTYFNVYYYDKFRMFELRYMFDSAYNNIPVLSEYRSSYFVFHKDSLSGYSFNFKDNFPVKKYSVDSLLKEQALQNFHWASITKLTSPHSIVNDKTGDFTETYAPDFTSRGISKHDTVIFYYSRNMNHVPFSFSNELDSTKRSKLYKIRLLNDSTRFGPNNTLAPKRESYFEIKDLKVNNEEQLKQIFELYKKRIQ